MFIEPSTHMGQPTRFIVDTKPKDTPILIHGQGSFVGVTRSELDSGCKSH